jgi:hypothetical protein
MGFLRPKKDDKLKGKPLMEASKEKTPPEVSGPVRRTATYVNCKCFGTRPVQVKSAE